MSPELIQLPDGVKAPIIYFDNTRLTAFKECPRKYFLRHEKHWRMNGSSAALAFGSAWHEAMDIIWSRWKELSPHFNKVDLANAAHTAFIEKWVSEGMTPPEDIDYDTEKYLSPRTPGIAGEMINEYIRVRSDFFSQIEVLAVEQPFAVDIGMEGILYVGRLDKVFRKDGRIYVGEHKTTTAYKKDGPFRTDWLESWSPNSQIDGYLHAAHMLYGDTVKDVWVDGALVHASVHDGFKFIPVSRQTHMLDAWLAEAQYWAQQILEERKYMEELKEAKAEAGTVPLTYYPAFPKNTNSCGTYAGCSYRDICRFIGNPDQDTPPLSYVVDKWEPFDILKLEKLNLKPEAV